MRSLIAGGLAIASIALMGQGPLPEAVKDCEHRRDLELQVFACDAVLSREPKAAWAYSNRGSAYFDLGKYDLAIADATAAIRIDPKLAVAYNNRGWAYHKKGDQSRAHADLSAAIKLNPKAPQSFANRAAVSEALGQKANAIADVRQALTLTTDPAVRRTYEDLLKRLGG